MIWIYGGAFNPPTKAHLNIVKTLKSMYPDDHIMIVPVGNDYQKSSLIDFFHRYHMCQLTFEDTIISTIEHDQKYQGSFALLKAIKNETQQEVGFVIGADQLKNLTKWINYESLIKTYPCMIFKRADVNMDDYQSLLKKFYHYQIITFDYPIASTMIRKHLKDHLDHLDPKVVGYIEMHGLYKE
jgi:nicotinate-nucleotide adenylyltransferase